MFYPVYILLILHIFLFNCIQLWYYNFMALPARWRLILLKGGMPMMHVIGLFLQLVQTITGLLSLRTKKK